MTTTVLEEHPPKISIITVVYNSVHLLERTILSVLGQSYPHIEYIIIDGGSTDGTVDLIRRYGERIAYWVSEPDRGLYDAMNKGLRAATGDYVWFINSGDLVYTPDTAGSLLATAGESLPDSPPLIFYGDTMIVDQEYQEVGLRRLRPPKELTWKSFRHGMLVCHQAILVHRSIAVEFDLTYPHSADFGWVIEALKKAKGERKKAKDMTSPVLQRGERKAKEGKIVNTGMILCAFLDGGQSKRTIRISLIERFRIMRKHYGLIPTMLRHIPIGVRFVGYVVLKRRF